MFLKGWIKKYLHNKKYKSYYEIGSNSILLSSFHLHLENPILRKYLKIGESCIIGGNFIFESEKGQIIIGNHSYIGSSTFISRSAIIIGNNVTIAWGCTIYDHDSHSLNYKERRKDIEKELNDIKNKVSFIKNKKWEVVNTRPIIIKNDAWIGMNCIILKGVTIGEGAVVGAGSVVTRDVPSWTVVGGNPAQVIKKLEPGY